MELKIWTYGKKYWVRMISSWDVKMENIISKYLYAKQEIVSKGFSKEIEWQDSLNIDLITEEEFLSEAAWVILSSGLSVKVVSQIFDSISEAFFEWQKASTIVENKSLCFAKAYGIFSNSKKINAIVWVAELVHTLGYEKVLEEVKKNKLEFIQTFPFMGPATSYHFAKNIGLDVAKPDRHLIRIAQCYGYNCPNSFCSDISKLTDEKISVIDLVLWRYAVTDTDYLQFFQENQTTVIS